MSHKLAFGGLGFLFLASTFVATPAMATTDPIAELRIRIAELQEQLAKLMVQSNYNIGHGAQGEPDHCHMPFAHNLMIGSTDAKTSGEVTKLQQFLQSQGYTEAQITGYYGNVTAGLVMRWQKAHGMDFVTLKSGVGPMTRSKMKISCSSALSDWKTYVTRNFQVKYPEAMFTPVQARLYISGQGDERFPGVKLIASSRAATLGTVSCMYGESGLTSVCSAEGESGVGFVIVERTMADLVARLEPSLKKDTVVNGKAVVTITSQVEGDGSQTYFVPISDGQTLVIRRDFRWADKGFVTQELFDSILATLVIYRDA